MEKRIMATAKELADRITSLTAGVSAIGDQLAKAKSEIDKEIQDLKDAVAAGDLSAVESAVTDLETAVGKVAPVSQALDDLNPDVTPPTP
jgi:ABC-type transporter Mla subunit MlaD